MTASQFWDSTPAELADAQWGYEQNRKRNLAVAAQATAQIVSPHIKRRFGLVKKIFDAFMGRLKAQVGSMLPGEKAEMKKQIMDSAKARSKRKKRKALTAKGSE